MTEEMALLALPALGSFAAAFFGSYIRKKGENLAMKEDLDRLTRLVESIKHENAMFVEKFKAGQTHRFLAASERLAALQKAFSLWRGLFDVLRTDEFEGVLAAARTWWNENCLYLDKPARQAFMQGLSSIELGVAQRRRGDEMSEKLWQDFWGVPDAIFACAGVPPLAPDERPEEDAKAS
jgi:hypothetical protein